MTLRKLMTDRIVTTLLDSEHYGDYCRECGDVHLAHNRTVKILNALSDVMLFALYNKIASGCQLIPVTLEADNDLLFVRVGQLQGGMIADGSIHT